MSRRPNVCKIVLDFRKFRRTVNFVPREFCGQSPIASDDVSLKRWIIYNCHCMTVI